MTEKVILYKSRRLSMKLEKGEWHWEAVQIVQKHFLSSKNFIYRIRE